MLLMCRIDRYISILVLLTVQLLGLIMLPLCWHYPKLEILFGIQNIVGRSSLHQEYLPLSEFWISTSGSKRHWYMWNSKFVIAVFRLLISTFHWDMHHYVYHFIWWWLHIQTFSLYEMRFRLKRYWRMTMRGSAFPRHIFVPWYPSIVLHKWIWNLYRNLYGMLGYQLIIFSGFGRYIFFVSRRIVWNPLFRWFGRLKSLVLARTKIVSLAVTV